MDMKKRKILLWIATGVLFSWYLVEAYLPQREICAEMDNPSHINSTIDLYKYEKKWVEIEYEYGHSSMRTIGYYFLPNHSFGYFKIAGKDEFFCASTRELIELELRDVNFEAVCSKAQPRSDGRLYTIKGFVRRITDQEKNLLIDGYNNSVGEYKMKNTLENTNMDYVIEILHPEDEAVRLSSRKTWMIVFGIFFLTTSVFVFFDIIKYIKGKKELSLSS